MSTPSLESALKRVHVDHPRFKDLSALLKDRLDDAISGEDTKITWIIGPSHVGKSQLAQCIANAYAPAVHSVKKHIPVLFAPAKTATTTRLLPIAVLKALRAPYRETNQSAGVLTEHMFTQLRLAGCKGVLFDEVSQVVEPGSRVVPFEASEWFKELDNERAFAQVLLGVPRLNRLFEANHQLRNRSYKKIVWLPYDVSKQADLETYAGVVNTFLEEFRKAGWKFIPAFEVIVANCYLFAPGLVGHLSDLMRQLAKGLRGQEPGTIGMHHFFAAANLLEACGDPQYPAFSSEVVKMSQLTAAYRHVLVSNGL